MTQLLPIQPSLEGFCPIAEAVERLAREGGTEERGAVYTRREVVDFILDLAGYTVDKSLANYRLLEPSFGKGDFMVPIIERLLASVWRESNSFALDRLVPAIRGVELHHETFIRTRQAVCQVMMDSGVSRLDAETLLDVWFTQGDFLLCDIKQNFTHVVGNPPYVRQEAVPDVLMEEYRRHYKTIYDRADIYVPFIERSLSLLEVGGKLGFICADRWMKNRYGKKLRELVSKDYELSAYVDMVGTNAFHGEVDAYPAVTLIKRCKSGQQRNATRISVRPDINSVALGHLAHEMTAKKIKASSRVSEMDNIADGVEPWILENFDTLALIRRIEAEFPLLEQVGCKVGIGVATGADEAFIGDFDDLDVELSRKLPLVMTRDILDGQIVWRGKGVINPFDEDGKLVNLGKFPLLKRYLEARYDQIAKRHVAKRTPQNWYRTIDRIYPDLAGREKLLIPDIKGDASIVREGGRFYPHHNLYYMVSDEWDTSALQAVMRSGIAHLFVSLYTTRMRGGFLRFQAQYLRRIRLPRWGTVSKSMRDRLKRFSEADDKREINEAVASLYSLSAEEMALVEGAST